MRRKIGLLACVLLLLCSAARADSAIEWNGHTYKIFSGLVNWDIAKKRCEQAGGYLVTINSKAEQDFIRIQIMNHRGEAFWIGLEDTEKEGDWRWVTGEPLLFTNWGPNQPDNAGDGQDHACIHTIPRDWNHSAAIIGQWDDDFDNEIHGYICEWNTIAR